MTMKKVAVAKDYVDIYWTIALVPEDWDEDQVLEI
jgi:hypothetical protein